MAFTPCFVIRVLSLLAVLIPSTATNAASPHHARELSDSHLLYVIQASSEFVKSRPWLINSMTNHLNEGKEITLSFLPQQLTSSERTDTFKEYLDAFLRQFLPLYEEAARTSDAIDASQLSACLDKEQIPFFYIVRDIDPTGFSNTLQLLLQMFTHANEAIARHQRYLANRHFSLLHLRFKPLFTEEEETP